VIDLFDLLEEEDKDQAALQDYLKQLEKIWHAIFSKYASMGYTTR